MPPDFGVASGNLLIFRTPPFTHSMLPMRINQDVAEVLGLLIGDGCVFRYHYDRGSISGVLFTGSESEYWYYRDFVKPTFELSFGVHGNLFRRGDHTTRYRIYSKELVNSLEHLGVPVGRRKDASIPKIVFDSGQVTAFIRGFYHAEGSVYRRYSRPYNRHSRVYDNLLVIQIRTKLRTIMSEIADELASLGVNANRLTERDGVYTLRITNQTEIRDFLSILNPKLKTEPRS